MKIFIYLLALFALSTAHANNIIVNGTRFIYSEDSAEITIQMTNTGNHPSLAQVWLDEGNPEKVTGRNFHSIYYFSTHCPR